MAKLQRHFSKCFKTIEEHLRFLETTNLPDFIARTKNSYYTVLNVEPNANAAEIKKSYQQMMKHLHPDLNAQKNVIAQENFDAIQIAFKHLNSEDKRIKYDEEQRRSLYLWSIAGVLGFGVAARYWLIPTLKKRQRGKVEFKDVWHSK